MLPALVRRVKSVYLGGYLDIAYLPEIAVQAILDSEVLLSLNHSLLFRIAESPIQAPML